MKTVSKLWLGLIALAVFSPLGLLLPEHFKSGKAWGEWGIDEIKNFVGYIPEGLAKFSHLWQAPIPDYTLNGWGGKISYIISAILGIAIIVAVIMLLGKVLIKDEPENKGGRNGESKI